MSTRRLRREREAIENHGMDNPQRQQRIFDAAQLLFALSVDLKVAEQATMNEGSRSRLRTVCAIADGLSSVLRQLVLAYLPDAEIEKKLGEDRVASLQKGPTKRADPYGSLRYTLDAATAALGLTCQTDEAHQSNWDDLDRLFKLRRRITHPKTVADFECADPFLTERVRLWLLMIIREPAVAIGSTRIW